MATSEKPPPELSPWVTVRARNGRPVDVATGRRRDGELIVVTRTHRERTDDGQE